MFQGRSLAAKKELYKAITENLAQNPVIYGDDITIILYEPPLENWGVKDDKPASEVDLGFEIKV